MTRAREGRAGTIGTGGVWDAASWQGQGPVWVPGGLGGAGPRDARLEPPAVSETLGHLVQVAM